MTAEEMDWPSPTVAPLRYRLRASATPVHIIKKSYTSVSRTEIDDVRVVEVETGALDAARRRRAGRFLKGPIPLNDIALAARLPGAALPVFLAVHHQVALTRQPRVRLPRALMAELDVSKDGKARALRHLESAGLVRVERNRGRQPVVTLIITKSTTERA